QQLSDGDQFARLVSVQGKRSTWKGHIDGPLSWRFGQLSAIIQQRNGIHCGEINDGRQPAFVLAPESRVVSVERLLGLGRVEEPDGNPPYDTSVARVQFAVSEAVGDFLAENGIGAEEFGRRFVQRYESLFLVKLFFEILA